MPMRPLLLPLLFTLLTACATAPAPVPETTPPPEAQELAQPVLPAEYEAWTRAWVDGAAKADANARYSGFAAVLHEGQVVWEGGFGSAKADSAVVPTADTVFGIGSLTKSMTALVVVGLSEDGKLGLDDELHKHLPDYPEHARGVTIRHLLSHRSGIFNYTTNQDLMARRAEDMTPDQVRAAFQDKPLGFAPGSRYAYSNANYFLLGLIVEKVEGKPFADVLASRVATPAGMSATSMDPEGPGRADGMQPGPDGQLVASQPISMTIPFAAGAVQSSVADLARWHVALEAGKIVPHRPYRGRQAAGEARRARGVRGAAG